MTTQTPHATTRNVLPPQPATTDATDLNHVSVAMNGFHTFKQTGIVLEIGQNWRSDVQLQVGSASETINVYLYSVAFVYYDIGYGSAIALVFFILIVMLAAVMLYARQRMHWNEIGSGG